MTAHDTEQQGRSFEREKWQTEKALRERELDIKEREQVNREAELSLRRKEQTSSSWRNPLVIAIIAATLAAVGNAFVSVVNGFWQRQLENLKSEQARILEMIKTGDPNKGAENLDFLLKAGLISDPVQREQLRQFLASRKPGKGPVLPGGVYRGGIVGMDDAVEIEKLPADSRIRKLSLSVGQIRVSDKEGHFNSQCTAFLVAPDLALTAGLCVERAHSAELLMYDGGTVTRFQVLLPPVESVSDPQGLNYAVLRIDGKPGEKFGMLHLSTRPPRNNEVLSLVMFRGMDHKLVVTGTLDCHAFGIGQHVFHHLCDSGPGSSGAPVLSADGSQVLGIHFRRDDQGGVAMRIDSLVEKSKTLQAVASE